MSGAWVFLVTAMVTGLIAARARAARARRRLRAYERGEPVQVPVRVAGDSPYLPRTFQPGRLVTGGPAPEWRPKGGGAWPVSFAGATLLRTDVPAGAWRPGEFVVTVALSDGTLVRLATGFPSLALLQRILGDAPPAPPPGAAPVDLTKPSPTGVLTQFHAPPQRHTPYPAQYQPPYEGPYVPPPPPPPPGARPRRPVPWWSALLLGLTAGWAGVWGWFWTAGDVVDATVVATHNPGCLVRWADPATGDAVTNTVDCADSAVVGDVLSVLALPGSAHGNAITIGSATWFPVVVASTMIGAAVLGIVVRGRRNRVPAGRTGLTRRGIRRPAGGAGAGVPRLGEGEVVWSRIAEVMTARAAVEGWGAPDVRQPPDPGPPPRRWWQVPALRRVARRSALRLLVPLVFGAIAVGSGWSSWVTTARLASGDTAIADGVVTRTADDALLPFVPPRALVHYRAEGSLHNEWVPVREKLTKGQQVSVLFVAGHPGYVRYEGEGNGLPRQATVTGLVAVLAAALGGRRVARTLRDLGGVARARRGPARPWRFVRFVDHTGRPGVMLFSRFGDSAPVVALPLAEDDAAGPVPVSGEAEVHGEVAHNAIAVPVIEGHTWWPMGRATEVPPAAVRDLVNGTLPEPPRPPGLRPPGPPDRPPPTPDA